MTKRQIGVLMIAAGTAAILGLFALDFVGGGQFQGIGPAQRRAMLAAGAVILLGVTLLPLGDAPA